MNAAIAQETKGERRWFCAYLEVDGTLYVRRCDWVDRIVYRELFRVLGLDYVKGKALLYEADNWREAEEIARRKLCIGGAS